MLFAPWWRIAAALVPPKRSSFCDTFSEDDFVGLMWRLSKMMKPEASQRVGDKVIITFHAHQMAEE